MKTNLLPAHKHIIFMKETHTNSFLKCTSLAINLFKIECSNSYLSKTFSIINMGLFGMFSYSFGSSIVKLYNKKTMGYKMILKEISLCLIPLICSIFISSICKAFDLKTIQAFSQLLKAIMFCLVLLVLNEYNNSN